MYQSLIRTIIPENWVTKFRIWRRTRILNKKHRPAALVGKVKPRWRDRINDVLACPDNAFIPRVPNAGVIEADLLTMHNGIRIKALSYYGRGILNMLVENRGVHEPQEERAFADVMPHLPAAPVSLEMGAYWGFYSLWLKTVHREAHCHLIEPDAANLQSGKMNFAINGMAAEFENAFVGDMDSRPDRGAPTISVDGYCLRKNIPHLHLLHSDIQGFELKMLAGARRMFSGRNIDYVFISTHSEELHRDCISQLESFGYGILCSVDIPQSYSGDGLIVAKSPLMAAPTHLEVSQKPSPA